MIALLSSALVAFSFCGSKLAVAPGDTVCVRVCVTATVPISIFKLTFDYHNSVVQLASVRIGNDLAQRGFFVSNLNTALPFPAATPGTNANVLVQVYGGGTNSFTGTGLTALELELVSTPSTCAATALGIDPDCAHTMATTADLYSLCAPELGLESTAIETQCVAGAEPQAFFTLSHTANPLRGMVPIRLDLEHAGDVRVRLFGADGREARRWHLPNLRAGAHEIPWHGVDGKNQPLPSGVYYCSVESAAHHLTRRLVFVR